VNTNDTLSPPSKRKIKKSRKKKLGLSPGTPIYIGEQKSDKIYYSIMRYGPDSFVEYPSASLEQCLQELQNQQAPNTVLWINIDGLHDVAAIEKLANQIGLHPLVIEDIVNTTQRPKSINYSSYLHTTLKTLEIDPTSRRIVTEQFSLVLGDSYVISFQEHAGDCLNPLRDRIRVGRGRARATGSDYLFYAILDSIVDHYFVVVEEIDDRIESLEEQLLVAAENRHLSEIHRSKRDLLNIRRSLWPLREVVLELVRGESKLINDSTRIFIRDIYDHTIEIIEVVELLRDTSGGLLELYISHSSNRVNMVMKTLTVIATIFMPLTFIVGVYGMNFDHFPEIHWTYGYPIVWAVMLLITLAMLVQFRRKGWI
jgi:magnesium transporter